MKNPFKKSSIIDTVVNVGIGGGANVAIDYLVDQVDMLKSISSTYINAGKIVLGAFAGTMLKNKYARAAADGVATVGAANLVSSFITGSTATPEAAAGLPSGTIGRIRLGNKNYRRGVRGVGSPVYSVMQP